MEREDDRGQATPLMAAAIGVVAVLMLGLGPMARALDDRAQARTAADAAALAGAAEGEDAAREMAGANHAELVGYQAQGDEVVVKVAVGGVTAFGRARRVEVPAPPMPGSGTGERAGLAPSMLAALALADQLLGQPVPISSGYRSPAQQQALWERRATNPYPVARPGRSMHERGLAVDVPRSFVDDLLAVAAEAGLCQPLPATDPVHFELCRR
jgi:D-alanyl-D-alanine carboxypeptidase